jgi:predicted alpha/beta hydrolase
MFEPGEIVQVRLRTLDGCELGAAFCAARAPETVRRAVVLHCGAGIAAVYYTHFARFLATAGIPVFTYDYRGIGRSRPATLTGFHATHEDWAEYDCTAAIAWMRERFPEAELIGIAHSFGSLIAGGARNSAEQARLVMIGPHTGYYGDYRALYRVPMTVLWHAIMPAVTRILGYFPARRFGLGQDLPREIALQWAGRLSPSLELRGTGPACERRKTLLARCAALRRPALSISISDDAFATLAGARRLLSCYPGLSPVRHIELTPADAGTRRIGHFGFFRRSVGKALWPRLLADLEAVPR